MFLLRPTEDMLMLTVPKHNRYDYSVIHESACLVLLAAFHSVT